MAQLTSCEYYQSRGFLSLDHVILIYDMFMGWSNAVAAEFNVWANDESSEGAAGCLAEWLGRMPREGVVWHPSKHQARA